MEVSSGVSRTRLFGPGSRRLPSSAINRPSTSALTPTLQRPFDQHPLRKPGCLWSWDDQSTSGAPHRVVPYAAPKPSPRTPVLIPRYVRLVGPARQSLCWLTCGQTKVFVLLASHSCWQCPLQRTSVVHRSRICGLSTLKLLFISGTVLGVHSKSARCLNGSGLPPGVVWSPTGSRPVDLVSGSGCAVDLSSDCCASIHFPAHAFRALTR